MRAGQSQAASGPRLPSETHQPDLDTLREEFVAAVYGENFLGRVRLEELVKVLVGTFYESAAQELALQEPLKVGLLRQTSPLYSVPARSPGRSDAAR
ncbi:MAG TPA: hypothetical protein VH877_22775 [Polyangia bacterium]|nr:hypothetical protein [Polyangia bacterium]